MYAGGNFSMAVFSYELEKIYVPSASVSDYLFTSGLGTYTEISGGTIHGTNLNDNENFLDIPLGFTFTYNGVAYNNVSIQANGFIAMGENVVTSNISISSATGTNNIVAALNRDIKSRDTGELMSLMSGTAPNRVFTVQWKHYRRAPTIAANDDFNFQIQLFETSNTVQYVYGPFTAITSATAATVQIGLRGNSNTEFNNRTTTTDWSATEKGTTNNNSCTLSASVFPADGLTYTLYPPSGAPENLIASISDFDVALYWNSPVGNTPLGYDVYRLQPGQETNEASWTLVSGSVAGTTCTDTQWQYLAEGNYKWAVKAIYTGGIFSSTAFSNLLVQGTPDPDIDVTPVSITQTMYVDANHQMEVTISNLGNSQLNWSATLLERHRNNDNLILTNSSNNPPRDTSLFLTPSSGNILPSYAKTCS